MADETREVSTTTAGLWSEAVLADLDNENRWLYFMKGTGSGRDMRLALGVLREWLQTIEGEITVVGQNGQASLTNLLLSIVDSNNYKVELGPGSLTFSQVGGTTSLTITKTGITANGSGGSVTITNGAVTIAKDSETVTVNKDGVSVTDGTYTSEVRKDYVSVEQDLGGGAKRTASISTDLISIEDEDGNETHVEALQTRSSVFITDYGSRKYTANLDSNDTLASTIKSTLEGVNSVFKLSEGSATAPNLYLDHTGVTDGYVIAVDWRSNNGYLGKMLTVFTGDTSVNTAIVMMPPNTMRKFRFVAGAGAHWEELY